MPDRPIIFSAPMIRALLDGRKTQTRRLLKISKHRTFSQFGPSDTKGYDWHFRDAEKRWHDYRHDDLLKRFPYAISDRLWVKEGFCHGYEYDGDDPVLDDDGEMIEANFYRADTPDLRWVEDGIAVKAPWCSPIHMPRWASRLTLTVTEVRVQRLQDISEADAKAEGAPMSWAATEGRAGTWRQGFQDLWNSIHGPEAWAANPWVVALTFTVRKGNIDA